MNVPPSVAPVSRDDIAAAASRIAPHLSPSPVLTVASDELGMIGAPLHLKLDLLQPTGSFKVRGALAALTAADLPAAGVVAASGGNFGLAVAWAAGRLGVPATIFVPSSSPTAKIDRLRSAGAQLHVVEGYYTHALAEADRFLGATGALGCHAYDDADVVAGQGTAAREFTAQADLDTIVVACGGGGLVAGIASWVGDDIRVVAVETQQTATLASALAAGAPVDVEVGGVAASSLGASRIGQLAWDTRHLIDDVVTVTDEAVTAAQRRLWQACRLVAEPGGAAAMAAVLAGKVRRDIDERIGVMVCGANTDAAEVVT